jgi:hypothetical protein
MHACMNIFDNAVGDKFHLRIFRPAGPKDQTANGGDFIIEDVV